MFLGFRHVFHGKQSRRCASVFDLKKKKTLQSGWEIFYLSWIENSSAVGKLQPIPDKFRFSTCSLPISLNPHLIPSVDGQNREEKLQIILKTASIGYHGKCIYSSFFPGKQTN